jgi:uncharacterized protein with GYD domain
MCTGACRRSIDQEKYARLSRRVAAMIPSEDGTFPHAMKTTYLSLLTFTDEGAREMKQSPERATAWRSEVEATGVKVLAQLWTVGAYDGALLLEGSDEKQILSALARLAALGNVRTHSLRAFDAEEFANVVGA